MFDIVSTGLCSYGVASKIMTLVSAGLDVASIVALVFGAVGGVGVLAYGIIAFVKREVAKRSIGALIMF